MSGKPKCGGCDGRHVIHRGPCPARAASSCQRVTFDGGTAIVCGSRPPCPCSWRTCACGQGVAIAIELPPGVTRAPSGQVVMVPVARGSAGEPAGRLAVRVLEAGGWLACRDLTGIGEQPADGEWRGTEHDDEQPGHKITYQRKEAA